jgi:DNA invertase Pin-like site-specific DNA recombinase
MPKATSKKEQKPIPKTIAYLRVSTNDRDTEKFKLDILKLAHERDLGKVEFAEEKASGKIHWKERKIHEIIERLGEGDHLIVPELSRLGRSMLEIMEILAIAALKEINVYIVKREEEKFIDRTIILRCVKRGFLFHELAYKHGFFSHDLCLHRLPFEKS